MYWATQCAEAQRGELFCTFGSCNETQQIEGLRIGTKEMVVSEHWGFGRLRLPGCFVININLSAERD